MLKRFSEREAVTTRSAGPRRRFGLNWIPWQAVASHVARRAGFVDPGIVLRRLRAFAKPSEVGEPIELLRAGAVFHARGLINTRAIQFNLDWVWPYWVEQQFNPHSASFIPRAFSFSHINLTHRNWTAVGLPDVAQYPIVDPRGLVTPLFDGWSLDFWIADDETPFLPSRCAKAQQELLLGENVRVQTQVGEAERFIQSTVELQRDNAGLWCVIDVAAAPRKPLVVAVRPYNPEGVSFIDSLECKDGGRSWTINGMDLLEFSETPRRWAMSCYESGDVLEQIREGQPREHIDCPVGMATGAAVFERNPSLQIRVPVAGKELATSTPTLTWRKELEGYARLSIPNERWQRLYDQALATVILHAPGEVFPGPYTYRRFWYRDAAFILNALLTLGGVERTRRALELFPKGQLRDGYFRSQEGEWDSNGQVLWIMERYCALAGEAVPEAWVESIQRGAEWIRQKRFEDATYPGLLPAGFSAEHLGPNDYYYWDDFWGVAGLQAAARLLSAKDREGSRRFEEEAEEFLKAINDSVPTARTAGAIPAAPGRRMDSGAVGSLVADYPLALLPAGDPRLLQTVHWLIKHSFVRGGFFQNMIHSGINAYLTLHVAQVLLRAGDQRAHALIESVAELASPTGQWPEAIHPRTGGGCMGDGQHVWAAAEWLMMMRNLFVREEGEQLIICSGIPSQWLDEEFHFTGSLSAFGPVDLTYKPTSPDTGILQVTGRGDGTTELVISLPNTEVKRRENDRFYLQRVPSQ